MSTQNIQFHDKINFLIFLGFLELLEEFHGERPSVFELLRFDCTWQMYEYI